MMYIALKIKLEDGSYVFYRGERVGFDGKLFRIFKFRTMIVDAEKSGASSTSDDDSRVIKIGKFLRKYKLDELPQLINVLKGEMSFVGPRPEVKKFTDLYSEKEKQILSVRPGITDWASIWNANEGMLLAGAEDPDKAYLELIRPTKIKLQLRYIREKSFGTDMKIIYLTLMAVLMPKSRAVENIRDKLISMVSDQGGGGGALL
jgi:lipopolysaccharide/colanic/teichoic acid biosynthesis glycosyltransferase